MFGVFKVFKENRKSFGLVAAVWLFPWLLSACGGGEREVPNLVGEWHGVNKTVSDLKGFQEWKKTVHITEQRDRRFRGHFEYSEGRKDFFGVIHPGNRRFSWVASDSKGYNFGRIHRRRNKISSCYIESREEATAGCAVLTRVESEE